MTKDRRGSWIVLGAAAATFVGGLLPWATGPFGISVSGVSGDGVLAIILAVFMAGFGWLMVTKRWAVGAAAAVSVLTIAMMIFEVIHITGIQFASLGIGVIVCLCGGIGGLVGALVGRRHTVEASVPIGASAPPRITYSPDGKWWWDGTQWVPVAPPAP